MLFKIQLVQQSCFSSPKKGHKQGSLEPSAYRLVIDYRGLNRLCISDSYPVPSLQDATEFIGATQFAYPSSLDLSNSFFQMEIDKDSRKYTAVSTGQMGGIRKRFPEADCGQKDEEYDAKEGVLHVSMTEFIHIKWPTLPKSCAVCLKGRGKPYWDTFTW